MDTNKKHDLVGDNKQFYLNASKGFELGFCSSSSFFLIFLIIFLDLSTLQTTLSTCWII